MSGTNTNKLLEFMKMGNITIPKYIFLNYKKINLTSEEFILIIYLINNNGLLAFNPKIISQELDITLKKVLELINSLTEKQIISIELVKNKMGVMEEFISCELFYNKISMLMMDEANSNENVDSNLFQTFEDEFGRTLSPMEYEIINGWIKEKFSNEIIIEALKEATFNGVSSLRYIDKILYEWKKKGYKTVNDVRKNNIRRNKKEEKIEIFDYDWLNGDEKWLVK